MSVEIVHSVNVALVIPTESLIGEISSVNSRDVMETFVAVNTPPVIDTKEHPMCLSLDENLNVTSERCKAESDSNSAVMRSKEMSD